MPTIYIDSHFFYDHEVLRDTACQIKQHEFEEIAQIEEVVIEKDPILFGRINDCADRFYIAQWDDDVSAAEKTRRRRLLEEIQEQIAAEINARLLGQTVEILVEGGNKGKWRGRTRTNKLVFFEADGDWLGRLVSVEITWTGPWSMQGKIGSDQSCPV